MNDYIVLYSDELEYWVIYSKEIEEVVAYCDKEPDEQFMKELIETRKKETTSEQN